MNDMPRDDGPAAPGGPDRTDVEDGPAIRVTADAPSENSRAEESPAEDSLAEDGGTGAPGAAGALSIDPSQDEPAPVVEATPPGERIAKAMARAGIASRRDAEAMILAGRVSVNGRPIASPALNVTEDDRVSVDGEPLPARERSRLWIFHKPRGLVTTARDPEGRQTVFEALPEDLPRVVAVGRLDINTEGLLLLTNDGGLAKVIAHPDTGWLRRYRVRAHGDTDQARLDGLSRGVTIDGMEYGPIEATLDRVQGDNLWITLGLREGKNREVKRILEHLGLTVNRLIRLSFGPFQLGDLEPGLVEEVRTRVLKDQLGKTLAERAGVDFESPVREPIAPFGGAQRAARAAPAARPTRDAARPAKATRVATGGLGSGPRKSAWSDRDATPTHRPGRAPRRGADPRAAQAAAAAERGRERVGAIRSGDRRVLVERLGATPAAPAPEEAPRRRYADRGGGRPRPDQRSDADGPRDAGRPPREAARGGAPTAQRRAAFPERGERARPEGDDRRGGTAPARATPSGDGYRKRAARPDGGNARSDGDRGPSQSAGTAAGARDGTGNGTGTGTGGYGAARARDGKTGGFKGGFGKDGVGKGGFGKAAAGKGGFAKGGGAGATFAKAGAGRPAASGGKPAFGAKAAFGGRGGDPKVGGRPAGGKPGGSRGGARPGGGGGFGGKPGGGRPSGGRPNGGRPGSGRPPRGTR